MSAARHYAPAPAKRTMYLAPSGAWVMVEGEPLICDKRHNHVARGVSAGIIVFVVCAHGTPRTSIERALKSIPLARRVNLNEIR